MPMYSKYRCMRELEVRIDCVDGKFSVFVIQECFRFKTRRVEKMDMYEN